jgi:CBS domain containing-hemolysin-like protein
MFWFFLGCVLYVLLVLSERALLAITPHEIDLLRADADDSVSARRALALADGGTRPALAALTLARLLLKIGMVVGSIAALMRHAPTHEWLYHLAQRASVPPMLVWTLLLGGLALLFATLFWRLKKANFGRNGRLRAGFWLQRLSRYVQFWQTILWPFLPKKIKKSADTPQITPTSATATTPELSPEKREIELLKSIVKFGDVTVRQVMQPRTKVVGLTTDLDFGAVLATVRETGFSRYPVFGDDLDSPLGILYVKDLVSHLADPPDFAWQNIVHREPMVVPESKHIDELLQDFKHKKRHMAVVVDEFGGTSGIVTMEDILEEVTGEIRDEFDVEQDEVPPHRQLDAHNFVFSGQMHLNDVCRIAGLAAGTFESVRGDADTLAGLAIELAGDMPTVGAEIRWEDFLLTVLAADQRRLTQIKLTLDHRA